MNINNLNTYQKPLISLAEACLNRESIGRDLETGPAFTFKEAGRTYNKTIYLDIDGNPVNRKVLIDQYNLSGRQVLNIFDRSNGDYIEAHKQLLKSSEHEKRKIPKKD